MQNRDNRFLPISKSDMEERGIETLDFVYVCGDAYIDHPAFGHAIITRVLESRGYSVGIIAQPDWKNTDDFKRLGRPRLAFLVSAGNIDSMVNHYTVNKKRRSEDMYSPGGKSGMRPDRATIVYCNKIREAYPGVQIIIGGIEASLRRFAHYDYWDNKVRRSILSDSRADVLTYGMGEKIISELADALNLGIPAADTDIDGCCYMRKNLDYIKNYIEIPSYEEVLEDKYKYALATKIQFENQDSVSAKVLVQKHGDRYLIVNKPMSPLDTDELDKVYELPYVGEAHPIYRPFGGVPAIEEVRFSVTNNRGCFGECNFCALTFHQGRSVRSRSTDSVVREVKKMTENPHFKGYIHDIGGPTANFEGPSCQKQLKIGTCTNRRCLFPNVCKNMDVSHKNYLKTLRAVSKLDKVKKVFIRSGIRYDYLLADKDDEFFKDLVKNHVSGQLRTAPEHVSNNVLRLMGKPPIEVYNKFVDKFCNYSKKIGKNQYVVPYLMSSHPGSTIDDAIELALYMKKNGIHPKQVQDFYPTPFTVSTCMYYTGLNPIDMQKVYVARNMEEKQMQRALLQFSDPKNHALVIKALLKAGRGDLIGFEKECLVRPRVLNKEKRKIDNKDNKRKDKKIYIHRKESDNNGISNTRRKKSFAENKRRTEKKGDNFKGKRH